VCKCVLPPGDNPTAVNKYINKTLKTTNQIKRRFETFINKCLRQIMNIKWTDKITNEELWRITKQKPIELQIKRKK
jgi:hypothetical protein